MSSRNLFIKPKPKCRVTIKKLSGQSLLLKTKTKKTCKGVPRKKGCKVAKKRLVGCPYLLADLKKIAKKAGLVGYSKLRKAQLCKKLKSMRVI